MDSEKSLTRFYSKLAELLFLPQRRGGAEQKGLEKRLLTTPKEMSQQKEGKSRFLATLYRNSIHKSFRFPNANPVILSPVLGRRTSVVPWNGERSELQGSFAPMESSGLRMTGGIGVRYESSLHPAWPAEGL